MKHLYWSVVFVSCILVQSHTIQMLCLDFEFSFAPRCANSYTLTFGLLSTTFGVRQKTRVQFTVILSYSVMQFSILHGPFYLM